MAAARRPESALCFSRKAMLAITKMSSDGTIELKKGGCYGVRLFSDSSAQLEWMLPPRVLRRR
jgi:hypothetical protein